MHRILGIIAAAALTACAVKPAPKVAHGEDHNLFAKEDLLGRPLAAVSTEPVLLPGLARPAGSVPDALKPLVAGLSADAVSFDLGETYLTVNAGKDGATLLPARQFQIKGQYDLVPQANAEGVENQYLVRDQAKHVRWQDRLFVEVDPAAPMAIKADDSDVLNLYSVQSLKDKTFTYASPADLSWLAPADRDTLAAYFGLKAGDTLKIELSRRYFSLLKLATDGSARILAQGPAIYVDLIQKKTDKGEPTPQLIKDKTDGDWEKRSFVSLDPDQIKLATPDTDLLKHLYAKATVTGAALIADGKDTAAMIAASAAPLKDGDQLTVKLTEQSVYVYASGKLLLKYPVLGYYDVLPSKDSEGVTTSTLARDDKTRPWSDRSYVAVNPDDVETVQLSTDLVNEASQIFAVAVLDGKCMKPNELPAALKAQIAKATADSVCFKATQSVLSVYAASTKALVLTYDITSHFDIDHPVSPDGRETSSILTRSEANPHWEARTYFEVLASAPHAVIDMTQPNTVAKDAFAGEFIYTAVVTDAHSENGLVFPGATLQAPDRLSFEMAEDHMTAYKVHETLNGSKARSPVLRYSVTHFDLVREKNGWGDESNVIDENREKPWDQRASLRADFATNDIASYFTDMLGFEKLYEGIIFSAHSTLASGVDISDGMISFDTEEVLTPNAAAGYIGSGETILQPVAVKIHHAFVKVGARPYQAKAYDRLDFQKFGYFDATEYGIDPLRGKTDQTLKHYIRRFDLGGKKHIDYYLNPEFPAKYKAAARQVVQAWNVAFKAAVGRDDVLVLHEETAPNPADPRYNMMVFIGDRNDAGLLGYGPNFFDPVSGENLSGKTYLYADGIQYTLLMAGDYYDLITGKKSTNDFAGTAAPTLGATGATIGGASRAGGLAAGSPAATLPRTQATALVLASSTKGSRVAPIGDVLTRLSSLPTLAPAALKSEAAPELTNLSKAPSAEAKFQGCLMQPDYTLSSAMKFIDAHKDLTKDQLLAELEDMVVFTTLLHEMGHNLGLRHNFKGSFDETNFPDAYHQLADLSKASAYRTSSVMDYSDTFEDLYKAAGPYDVAAIKFGYGDKLEQVVSVKDDGTMVTKDLAKKDFDAAKAAIAAANPALGVNDVDAQARKQLSIRPYMFCTDENTDEDPTCNRFDSGTTVTDIIKNLEDDYETHYKLYAFRRDRREFTGSSSGVVGRYIMPVRHLLDEYVYNLINNSFATADNDDGSANPASPADYLSAINEGLNFYLKILHTLEPGVYHFDAATSELVSGRSTDKGAKNVVIDLDHGKYMLAQTEQVGNDTLVTSRGIELDKIAVLYALSLRGYPAAKYERAALAANYFDVAKTFTMGIYSSVIRDDLTVDLFAKRADATGDFLPVDDASVTFDATNANMIKAKIRPSTNLAVKEYASLFSIIGYDTSADRTFRDYIDYRIDGVDAAFPSGAQTAQFTSPTGLKTYVVANTMDSLSISYKIATKGAQSAKDLADAKLARAAAPDPAVLKAAALKDFLAVYRLGAGKALDQASVDVLTQDLDDNIPLLRTLGAQFVQTAPDPAKKDQLTALVATMTKDLDAYTAASKAITTLDDKVTSVLRDLTKDESDLIGLRDMYTAFH